MKFTTKQLDSHISKICVDGVPTEFYIVKGEDPKFGMAREWHLGQMIGDQEGPYLTAYRRKSDALEAFRQIYSAGFDRAILK